MISFFSPLTQSDKVAVEDLLRADTDKWIKMDPINGIEPTQAMLRCLQHGRNLQVSVMQICCSLLQKRDRIICDFYNEVNKSNTTFQERLKSCYIVNSESQRLSEQLPNWIPYRIFVAYYMTCM